MGGEIEVAADAEGTQMDGWYLQTFTPSGTVEWAWSVTATAPGEHALRLMLRPAVAAQNLITRSSTGQQSYETQVTVKATALEGAWYWFDTQFPLVGKIASAIGTSILALLAWAGLFSEKWGRLRKRSSQSAPQPSKPNLPVHSEPPAADDQ